MEIARRFERILELYFVLQSRSVVRIEELEKRFGITKRTIYRDLKALDAVGVPVMNNEGKGFSIMEGFRIQPSRFTQEEVLSLMVAEKIMQQHETQVVKRHFESALMKVRGSFQPQQKIALDALEDKLQVSAGVASSEYLPNVITLLLESINARHLTTIFYMKSSEITTTERIVEPVSLFYENGFWYLLAFCHLRNDYRSFRLDRVKNVVVTQNLFTREHPSPEILRNIETPEKTEKIIVRVSRPNAHYMFWERQSFGFISEVVSDTDVIMEFMCTVHPISFVRWFMKFVDFGEILSPASLKDDLNNILTDAVNRRQI